MGLDGLTGLGIRLRGDRGSLLGYIGRLHQKVKGLRSDDITGQ
jgi:hypothetical protein